jgi:Trk K+ transport system NAD-binding subunit
MKIFTCNDHYMIYPVGCASVVVARDEAEARRLLDDALRGRGMLDSNQSPYTLVELDIARAQAVILVDGDY